MHMISRFSLTSYEPAGFKLSFNNYLFKETRNKAKVAMHIVEVIRKNLSPTWERIDTELMLRKDDNWNHPGKVLDLAFLSKIVKHA